eukprot:CAMPEP_0115566970 /NCGR_PEP_ID=MMETSP0271-20121206/103859_1 /TAXON_ID=71861 /ORGANISM="Scrippsiella trochoidea, Strain CCMP3099" /LENGTH=45 /DNA_ID= /DNA_START= /DNA_END= /DNA_ORIENTATION=
MNNYRDHPDPTAAFGTAFASAASSAGLFGPGPAAAAGGIFGGQPT